MARMLDVDSSTTKVTALKVAQVVNVKSARHRVLRGYSLLGAWLGRSVGDLL